MPLAGGPYEIDVTPDGTTLLVTARDSREIVVVSVAERRELRRIPVAPNGMGDRPFSIAVTANGKALFTTTTAPNFSGF